MEERQHIPELSKALAAKWDMEINEDSTLRGLEEILAKRLAELLDHDFERLVQAMYRLDVDESKFELAISRSSVKERATALAQLVLQREIQRLEFRKKYQGGGKQQT